MSKNGRKYNRGTDSSSYMDNRVLYIADERMKSYNPERHRKERKFKSVWDDKGVEHFIVEEENNLI